MMLDKEIIEYLVWVKEIAYECVVGAYYFEIVSGRVGTEFWNIVQISLGDGVCINWCHLFGNCKDDLHYSKFFNRPDILEIGKEYSKEQVKKRILNIINYSDEQYKIFWQEIKSCRDKFLDHKEKDAKVIYPNINYCRLMTEELILILGEVVRKLKEKYPDDKDLSKLDWFCIDDIEQLHNKCLTSFKKVLAIINKCLRE